MAQAPAKKSVYVEVLMSRVVEGGILPYSAAYDG